MPKVYVIEGSFSYTRDEKRSQYRAFEDKKTMLKTLTEELHKITKRTAILMIEHYKVGFVIKPYTKNKKGDVFRDWNLGSYYGHEKEIDYGNVKKPRNVFIASCWKKYEESYFVNTNKMYNSLKKQAKAAALSQKMTISTKIVDNSKDKKAIATFEVFDKNKNCVDYGLTAWIYAAKIERGE